MSKILEHINALRALLPALHAGEIGAIEFGEEGFPLGFMSHHRIQYIETPAGTQLTFKPVHRGQLGSGHYLGNPDEREIEIHAQSYLDVYLSPSPLRQQLEKLRASSGQPKRAELKYFAVPLGEAQ